MEFGPTNIARLVLGYLKEEQMKGAYNELLQHSPHLIELRKNKMKFYTRVNGMSLVNFLTEYETVYTIIQRNLECTDFFNDFNTRTSLAEQLQYLLDNAIKSSSNDQNDKNEELSTVKDVELPNCNVGGQDFTATSSVQKPIKDLNSQDLSNQECDFEQLLAQSYLDEKSGRIENELGEVGSFNELSGTTHENKTREANANIFEGLQEQSGTSSKHITPKKKKVTNSTENIKGRLPSNKTVSSPLKDYVAEDQNRGTLQYSSDLTNSVYTSQSFSSIPTVQLVPYNSMNNMVMLQSNNTTSNILASNNMSYYLGNNNLQPQLNFTSPEFINNVPMIICKNQEVPNIQTTGFTNPKKVELKIAPAIKENTGINEFLTLFSSTEDSKSCKAVELSPIAKANTKKRKAVSKKVSTIPDPPPLPTVSINFEVPISVAAPSNSMTESSNVAKSNSLPSLSTPKANNQDIADKRNRSTPRNGSHVRQLNFSTSEIVSPSQTKIPSPVKVLQNEQKQKVKQPATSKSTNSVAESELENPPIEPQKSILKTIDLEATEKLMSIPIWDADLRSGVHIPEPEKPTKRVRRKSSAKTRAIGKKTEKTALNSTDEDAEKIELALADIGTHIEDGEDYVSNLINETNLPIGDCKTGGNLSQERTEICDKEVKCVVNVEHLKLEDIIIEGAELSTKTTETLKLTTTSVKTPTAGKPKNTKADKLESSKLDKSAKSTTLNKRRDRATLTKGMKKSINIEEKILSEGSSPDNDLLNSLITMEETKLNIRNRNSKSKARKKCNMENVTPISHPLEEVVVTNIPKIKSCQLIDESHKLILSPSKLCPTKRNLENRSVDLKTEDSEQPITPELTTVSSNMPLLGAKCDLMPLLETPMKSPPTISIPVTPGVSIPITPGMSMSYPVTPGLFSLTPGSFIPYNDQTPYAFLKQIDDVDLGTIPTPKFPFTPQIENGRSPLPSRPTDYSTCSSSYYQPSDTEHNKSMELLIEETKRLERDGEVHREENISNESAKNNSKDESSKSQEEILDSNAAEPAIPKFIQQKAAEFNENLIAKKDLSKLYKPDISLSSCSSNNNSSSSSSSDSNSNCSSSSSSSSEDDSDNEPSVVKIQVSTNPYALRSKTPVATAKGKLPPNNVSRPNRSAKARLPKHQVELDAKLQRTINFVKEDNLKTKVKTSKSTLAGLRNKIGKTLPKKKPPAPRKSTLKKGNSSVAEKKITSKDLSFKESDRKEKVVQFLLGSEDDSLDNTILERTVFENKLATPMTSLSASSTNDNKQPDEESKVVNDNVTDVAVSSEKQEPKMVDTQLQAPNVSSQLPLSAPHIEFDVDNLSDKIIVMTHDEQHKVKSLLSKVSSDILNKKFSANVYLDTIDKDVEIFLSVTPMEFALDMPSESEPLRRSPRKSLNIISNCIVRPACSPLDFKNVFDNSENVNTTKASEVKLNSIESQSDSTQVKADNSSIEDLMDYAVVGDKKTQEGDEPSGADIRKRKRNDISQEKSIVKKKKNEEQNSVDLLKHVDVDSFLQQVHGNSN